MYIYLKVIDVKMTYVKLLLLHRNTLKHLCQKNKLRIQEKGLFDKKKLCVL